MQYAYKIYSSWYIIYFNTDTMIAHNFSMEDTTHASKNILKIFFSDTC